MVDFGFRCETSTIPTLSARRRVQSAGMAVSDRPFKLVHANPRMVEDVVRVVAPQWAHRLDYAALTAVDKEYVAREQRNRDALQALIQDKVWRAPIKDAEPLANGERPYVDILLEFQADVDPRMAWRMADYIHALRLNQRESGVEQREGRLPDLLSVVIHNGARAWNAPAVLPGPLVGPPTQEGRGRNMVRIYEIVDYIALAAQRDLFGLPLPPGGPLATMVELETSPPVALERLLREAFLRHAEASSAGMRRGFHARVRHMRRRRGMQTRGLLYYENWLRRVQQGGQRMPTLMEATWDKWFEEHDAQVRAEGRAEGAMRTLRRQAAARFGAQTAGRLSAMLRSVDVDRLDDVGDLMLVCETDGELLERVRELGEDGA